MAPTTLAAYAPPPGRPSLAEDAASATGSVPETAAAPGGKGERIVIPSPRPERFQGTDVAALDTGVSTTPKTSRPSAEDVTSARPAIVPVDQINPARFGERTVTVASLTETGRPTERPEFIRNATRSAPEAVYIAGFSKAPPPDPNRLSGNAVTFLAVAKFSPGERGGGDGQPLTLQIPATN